MISSVGRGQRWPGRRRVVLNPAKANAVPRARIAQVCLIRATAQRNQPHRQTAQGLVREGALMRARIQQMVDTARG